MFLGPLAFLVVAVLLGVQAAGALVVLVLLVLDAQEERALRRGQEVGQRGRRGGRPGGLAKGLAFQRRLGEHVGGRRGELLIGAVVVWGGEKRA